MKTQQETTPLSGIEWLMLAIGVFCGAVLGALLAELFHRFLHGGGMNRWPPPRHFGLFAICILSGGILGMAASCWKRLGQVNEGDDAT